ncbi:hypothetical protein GB937_002626 [Aspergillus fischeri]|nr:hypothetical protein GB937_002626 [Aspergillus fischeri]
MFYMPPSAIDDMQTTLSIGTDLDYYQPLPPSKTTIPASLRSRPKKETPVAALPPDIHGFGILFAPYQHLYSTEGMA